MTEGEELMQFLRVKLAGSGQAERIVKKLDEKRDRELKQEGAK